MKLIHLRKADVEAFPQGAIWNAFVQLLAMSEPEELGPSQLPAQRAFWYDSEVQNGGHLQYFLNRGITEAQAAVPNLRDLSAIVFSELLREAISIWEEGGRSPAESAEEYVELALEAEFESIDLRYYSVSPPLTEILAEHLNQNQSRYVSVE